MTHFTPITIAELSAVSEARRVAAKFAGAAGMDPTDSGKLAIIVTELATNLVKHAGSGTLLISGDDDGPARYVEVISLDKGRGMRNVAACMQDGYSTSGSPGTGMGAISRLSSFIDVWSRDGQGTAVLARLVGRGQVLPPPQIIRVGGINVPIHGETVSGDAWTVRHRGTEVLIVAADGLGHGPAAHKAATVAMEVANRRHYDDLRVLFDDIHGALRITRGASVAVMRLDVVDRSLRFIGIGNIAGAILKPGEGKTGRQMLSHPGTVGHELRRVHELTYAWEANSVLVIHSDGITSHWNLETYPELNRHDPTLIASVIFRDFNRGRDDATVIVAKQAEP